MYLVFCVLSAASAPHFVECIFTEKMLAATLHFSLVSFPLGTYQIPLQSSVKVPVDFSQRWSRFLCCITLFVWWWQVSLRPCTFLSLKNFERCLLLSQCLFSLLLLGPLWQRKVSTIYLNHCSVTRGHLPPCLSGCGAEKKPEHTRATELFGEKLLEAPGNFLLANTKPHLGMTG